jgi:hypothetical protein
MKVHALLASLLLVAVPAGSLGSGIPSAQAGEVHAAQSQLCVYDHMTLKTGPGTCRPRAKAYPSYVRGAVKKAIYDSALVFGVPYMTLLEIARCESALNPRASNGTHFGLYQFAPATFRRASSQMREQIGVLAHSYWRALDSSYTAGYMFVTGSASSWSCISAITTPAG